MTLHWTDSMRDDASQNRVTVPTIYPRALLLLGCACTAGLTIFTPGSTTAELVSGSIVAVATKAVFVLAMVVLWLDMLINDLLPHRWHWRWAREHRWAAVMLVAITYLMFATLASIQPMEEGRWVIVAYYASVAAWCACFAFQAKVRRYRSVLESQRGDL